MTTRRLFLAKLAALAGFTLLSKAKGDYTKPLSLPVVVPRVQDFKGDSGKIALEFPVIDYDRLLYCISAVETQHQDHLIGPSGERSRYQIKRSVWEQHTSGILSASLQRYPFSACSSWRARYAAENHLRWLQPQLDLGPFDPIWPLAWAWRGGIGAWQDPYSISDQQHRSYCDYADRVKALFYDPTYQHT